MPGVLTLHPTVHTDHRGYFTRTWDSNVAREAGIPEFVQDSQSRSHRGVIRGLHIRRGAGESKLVRCARGRIFDVVVDLRRDSPTFLRWQSFELDDVDHVGLYIPRGCAHGWQAVSGPADVCYRIDASHDARFDLTLAFDAPELAIPWPEPPTGLSAADRAGATLAQTLSALEQVLP